MGRPKSDPSVLALLPANVPGRVKEGLNNLTLLEALRIRGF